MHITRCNPRAGSGRVFHEATESSDTVFRLKFLAHTTGMRLWLMQVLYFQILHHAMPSTDSTALVMLKEWHVPVPSLEEVKSPLSTRWRYLEWRSYGSFKHQCTGFRSKLGHGSTYINSTWPT